MTSPTAYTEAPAFVDRPPSEEVESSVELDSYTALLEAVGAHAVGAAVLRTPSLLAREPHTGTANRDGRREKRATQHSVARAQVSLPESGLCCAWSGETSLARAH